MPKITNPDFSLPEAQPFLLEGGDHAVLLLHGFTGSVSHMRLVGQGLHEAGFTVQGINLPGHAQDLEAMKRTHWQDWVGAARDALAGLRRSHAHVSMLGLSMGGCITLMLAEEGLTDAAITVSAPMDVQNPLMPFAGLLAPLIPTVSWGKGDPTDHLLIAKYHLGYGGFPTRCAVDLSKIIRQARANLSQVTCPVLSIQSHADGTIGKDSLDVIQSGISSRVKDTLWLEEVPHVCTITRETPRIVAKAADFLRSAV